MKKKLVGLMLSGMLVLSLAACGGDDAAADSTTVSTQAEVSTTSDTVAEEVTTEEVTTEEVTLMIQQTVKQQTVMESCTT